VKDVERIIALKPDLVVAPVYADEQGQAARLRAAGIPVWDLGELRGRATLLPAAIRIAALVGQEDLGRRWAAAFARRMDAVAARLDRPRRRALWVMPILDKLYGGTVGTSFHDVLTAAGLIDAAAERYRDWPAYAPEHLIALDPDLIVVPQGKSELLRRIPGLAGLRALHHPGGLVEISGELAENPGPGMLEAAEELFALAYPPR
jgi:iron complex transport system substrate-binding protein